MMDYADWLAIEAAREQEEDDPLLYVDEDIWRDR